MYVKQGTHPNGGAHAKFTNYSFDVKEFLRIVSLAEKDVKKHASFKAFIEKAVKKDKKPKLSKDEL